MKRMLVIVALLAAACAPSDSTSNTVVLMTHDSFAVSDGVFETFTEQTGITVEVLRSGDAGTMVNQAILTRDNPLADVLFGIDNTLLSRGVQADLFAPYRSAALDTVPTELRVPGGAVTPIDFGDVCLNYDIAALAASDTAPPQTLEDLTAPAYRDLVVVEDPATSSPGLAFLMATVATFGEGGWQSYWEDLFANGVEVTPGWEEAYYGSFSGGSGEGTKPVVVSYASSPPAEVFFSDLSEAPTAVVTDGCFRQVEYAGVLSGTEVEAEARLLIDFMLSDTFQADIPLNMFVFPANSEVALPEVFVEYTTIPDDPVLLNPAVIDQNRERWIAEWTAIAR